jgi:GNAT superfamily N-acetyltransferase
MSGGSPAIVLEVLPETDLPVAADQAIRRLLCQCFPADADVFARSRAWHGSAPTYSVLAWQRPRLVGHLGIVVRTIRCGDQQATVAGVQNFCVTPPCRGSGLGRQLMEGAFAEARRRQIAFGLLFCIPELEPLYRSLGWFTLNEPTTMPDDRGRTRPIPAKNVAMAIELGRQPFPAGPVHLQGRDW